jgi:hypothetical protein
MVKSVFCDILETPFRPRLNQKGQKGSTMSFGLYALGFVIVIGGLIYGAHLMHVPAHWIAVGAIVLLGIGIVTGVQNTRQKDPS